jgi:fructose-1,6-bisphosphatase/inositol monophosphatase family enzyme
MKGSIPRNGEGMALSSVWQRVRRVIRFREPVGHPYEHSENGASLNLAAQFGPCSSPELPFFMPSQSLVEFAVATTLEAGQVALDFFRRAELKTGIKFDLSLLSEADAATEEFIARQMRASFPGDPLIGEETAGDMAPDFHTTALSAERAWVVDPIDGTNNFVAGNPVWCVSVALLERGLPTLGVIYFPAVNDELYYNEDDTLFLRTSASSKRALTNPVPPSRSPSDSAPLFLVHDTFFRRYDVRFHHVPRISGCTVFNVLDVVLGKALAASHSAHLWDFAAPMAYARARAVEMAEVFSGRRLTRYAQEHFCLDPANPKQLWKVKEQSLVAPRARIEDLRKAFVRVGE